MNVEISKVQEGVEMAFRGEYLTFVKTLRELAEDRLIELMVADLSPGPHKYCYKRVRARVARSADKLPGADILWVRYYSGNLHPQPYVIKIEDTLDLVQSKYL
jgi:hypothetical protein